MELFGIKTNVVSPGSDLVEVIFHAVKSAGLGFSEDNVLVIASKLVSTCEKQLIQISSVKPSERALILSERAKLPPELAEVVIREADEIYGCVEGAILTLRDGVVQANAGVDVSNAPIGTFILLPRAPDKTAFLIHQRIKEITDMHVGVVICDSNSAPLRLGTGGLALGVAGFEPVIDDRGKKDIFGRALRVTQRNQADSLAHAAQLLMGESDEQTPLVVMRGAPIKKHNSPISSDTLKIRPEQCLFMGVLQKNE